jgi:hypothetical protein
MAANKISYKFHCAECWGLDYDLDAMADDFKNQFFCLLWILNLQGSDSRANLLVPGSLKHIFNNILAST